MQDSFQLTTCRRVGIHPLTHAGTIERTVRRYEGGAKALADQLNCRPTRGAQAMRFDIGIDDVNAQRSEQTGRTRFATPDATCQSNHKGSAGVACRGHAQLN